MSSKTLYITDLDGTLLDDSGRLSARSAALITRLSHEGAMISVATARTPATVVNLLADAYTTADLVVMTGAGLWNRPRGRFEHLDTITGADVESIRRVFASSTVSPFYYTIRPEGTHLDVYHPAAVLSQSEAVFVEQRSHLALKKFYIGHDYPDGAPVEMVLTFAIGSYEAITGVAEQLREATTCYVSYYKDTYSADTWLLEVFAHGVSKAAGIERLRRLVGADRVVAFGDNLNDLPMLRAADVAVAVGNALPQVKAEADVVIGSNNADSVPWFIEKDYFRSE